MKNIDHYVTHTTVANPGPSATYRTGGTHRTAGEAMEEAWIRLELGARAFVTGRDEEGKLVAVFPLLGYPETGMRKVPREAIALLGDLFTGFEQIT